MRNNKKIAEVGNPITLVEAENTGRGKTIREDNFGGLSSKMYLYIGVKVLLVRNYLNIRLSNGSTGTVKNIFATIILQLLNYLSIYELILDLITRN